MQNILVVVGFTDIKYYARPLWPKAFDLLDWPNKELLWVDDTKIPGLLDFNTGEEIAAACRKYGIQEARKRKADYIFFCDVDCLPDHDILTKLVETNQKLIAGVVVARGDSTKIIGHLYDNREEKNRYPLVYRTGSGVVEADGVPGGLLLVHKDIFQEVDYSGYTGQDVIPGRFTGDDEYFQIKVFEKLGIKPKLHLGARAWHFSTDGFAYRFYGQKKSFDYRRQVFIFEGVKYGKTIA